MLPSLLVALSLVVAGAPRAKPPASPAVVAPAAVARKLVKRTLIISDESAISEIHVAMGTPTTLVFPVAISAKLLLLADMKGRFYPPQVAAERSVILVPKEELQAGEVTTLALTLADGTVLPFSLVAASAEVDLQVDVELALQKRAAPESAQVFKGRLVDAQARLDECEATAASAGVKKVAAFILAQDLEAPQAFIVERHAVRHLDKQSRLLVETHQVYRLFNLTYLVLTIQNRDPSQPWVLERPEVAAAAGGSEADAKVATWAQDVSPIPPDEVARLVVAITTPTQDTGQRFTVRLLEKAGSRHVSLEDLKL